MEQPNQELFPLVGIESLHYSQETCSCQQSFPQSRQGDLQYQTVKKGKRKGDAKPIAQNKAHKKMIFS